jgi:nitroreductase
MNVLDTIKSRKSVRSYTGEAISDAELQAILTAAQAAPVGMKAYDSLVLTVIKNKELLGKIDKNAQATLNWDGSMLYGAPMLILVSTKLAGNPMDNVAYSNAATLVENMALEAVELGVGACHIWGSIMALKQNADLVKELGLPEGFSPVCAIALGKVKLKINLLCNI